MKKATFSFIAAMFCTLLVLITPTIASAQQSWTLLKALSGGRVDRVEIDAGGTLYCTAYGVLKSTDGGLNWASAQGNLPTPTVWAIVAHPSSPGVLFAATDQGLFKTMDGGLSWASSGAGLPSYNRHYRE